ncbi:MAG: hypothetical protein Q4B28_06225 [bacterium]|nr:hypothetical protein [bacterium]
MVILGLITGLILFLGLLWGGMQFANNKLAQDAEEIDNLLKKGEKATKKEDQNTDPLEHLLHRHE